MSRHDYPWLGQGRHKQKEQDMKKQDMNTHRTVVLEVVHKVVLDITDDDISPKVVAEKFAEEINASLGDLNAWPGFWADQSQLHIGQDPSGSVAFTANSPEGTRIVSAEVDIRGGYETLKLGNHYPMVEERVNFESAYRADLGRGGKWKGLEYDE